MIRLSNGRPFPKSVRVRLEIRTILKPYSFKSHLWQHHIDLLNTAFRLVFIPQKMQRLYVHLTHIDRYAVFAFLFAFLILASRGTSFSLSANCLGNLMPPRMLRCCSNKWRQYDSTTTFNEREQAARL